MPQTIVKETTVYTLAELEALGRSVHEKAIQNVIAYEWQDFEPDFVTEDMATVIECEFPLFKPQQRSYRTMSGKTGYSPEIEWSTNPNWVRAKGDIDLREYMRAEKLHRKYRALWYAIDVLRLESHVGVSFGYGESPDLENLRRDVDYDIDTLKYGSARYWKLHGQIDRLEQDIDNYMSAIKDRLLSNLRAEMDYRCSDEFAKEEAEAHELVFTASGSIYHG